MLEFTPAAHATLAQAVADRLAGGALVLRSADGATLARFGLPVSAGIMADAAGVTLREIKSVEATASGTAARCSILDHAGNELLAGDVGPPGAGAFLTIDNDRLLAGGLVGVKELSFSLTGE